MVLFRWSQSTLRSIYITSRTLIRMNTTTTASTSATTASTSASTTPSYTVSELPTISTETTVRRVVGFARNIRGHTKKLNPIARQVRNS